MWQKWHEALGEKFRQEIFRSQEPTDERKPVQVASTMPSPRLSETPKSPESGVFSSRTSPVPEDEDTSLAWSKDV
jgi:hypothetical protein